MNSIRDCYTLNNGVKIPCLGFGTYKAAEGDNIQILLDAIQVGYRYFDTASFYLTEEFLGEAIKKSGVPREEFFLVSKMWKEEMGYEKTKKAFADTLERLQTDYLDMYLIHWPRPDAECENWKELNSQTWKAMEELYEEGKIKALGVSNFLPHHLMNLLDTCKVKPAVNQLELHPGYMQEAAVQYCKEQGILLQAWSPIGRQRVLKEPLLLELAEKYHVTPARICLRYLVQRFIIPIPKSSDTTRMKQNMQVFDFAISEEDMYRISTMPQTGWSGEHPDPELATKLNVRKIGESK